jgi:hypothetical protein
MIDKVKKIKGRDSAELSFRLRQHLTQWFERAGRGTSAPEGRALGRLLKPKFTAESWAEHWRDRVTSRFFAGAEELDTTDSEFRRRFGDPAVEAVVERAERICRGQIDLLGLRGLQFGTPVDWHLEPVSGKRSPLVHWSQIDELETNATGDKKVVWELNRCQHFVDLGRAYVLTGDEKFAVSFADQIASWMDQNPPKQGVNWVSSLEISFRAIAWLWALRLFRRSPNVTPELQWRALGFLYLHGRHLEQYLSTYSSPNTHLTGEALGLFYLGIVLPEFKCAPRWREAGAKILNQSVKDHLRADGVYFEQSTYYHRYTADFYTHFMVLSERNALGFDHDTRQRLAAMFEHLLYIGRPDGTTPLIGDDDGGRLVSLDLQPRDDFRAALSNGAVLFERSDLRFGAGALAEETLWLLGANGARKFDALPAVKPVTNSRGFEASGFYVLRDGWNADATSLIIDCGPHGALTGAHGHADALSFDLSVRGRAVLVDPGTYTYTGSAEARDHFRSTGAHNALTIDGASSAEPAGPFSWNATAEGTTTNWTSRGRFDLFGGKHDGYRSLRDPAEHSRGVLFLHGDYFIMRDHVESAGAHRLELNFHAAAGLNCSPRADVPGITFATKGEGALPVLDLLSFAHGLEGAWRIKTDYVSRCHLSREPAPVAVYGGASSGAAELITFMLPRFVNEPPITVEELEVHGGRAFVLRGDSFTDRLILSSGGLLLHDGLWSDFRWAWVRFSEAGLLREAVLLDGKDFRVGDDVILDGSDHLEFARISRVTGQWVIETNAGLVTKLASGSGFTDAPVRRPRLENSFYVRD